MCLFATGLVPIRYYQLISQSRVGGTYGLVPKAVNHQVFLSTECRSKFEWPCCGLLDSTHYMKSNSTFSQVLSTVIVEVQCTSYTKE